MLTETEKIYTVTPYDFSVTVKNKGVIKTINDMVDYFKENNRLPDLDPTEPPEGPDTLDIIVNLADCKKPVQLQTFAETVKKLTNDWVTRWSSKNYYNELMASAKGEEVAALCLLPSEEESSIEKKVLYWNIKMIKGSKKELNELVYRMNQARILGPIEVTLF